jgi:hypothetical protein
MRRWERCLHAGGTTSRVTVADRPYGEFYDFYSVSLENFGYHLIFVILMLTTKHILICKYLILIWGIVLFSQKMTRLEAWLRNRGLVPDRKQIIPLFRSLGLMAAFLRGKDSRYFLNKILGAPQSRACFFGKKQNFLLLPVIKTKFFSFWTRILVTVLKVLIWPLMWCYGHWHISECWVENVMKSNF